jgi:hypothetical protein
MVSLDHPFCNVNAHWTKAIYSVTICLQPVVCIFTITLHVHLCCPFAYLIFRLAKCLNHRVDTRILCLISSAAHNVIIKYQMNLGISPAMIAWVGRVRVPISEMMVLAVRDACSTFSVRWMYSTTSLMYLCMVSCLCLAWLRRYGVRSHEETFLWETLVKRAQFLVTSTLNIT